VLVWDRGGEAVERSAVERGSPLGRLRLGSAVVLVFEAPVGGLQFDVRPGDVVRAGDPIGRLVAGAGVDTAAAPAPTVADRKPSAGRAGGGRVRRSW
jgi:predicted deacylase